MLVVPHRSIDELDAALDHIRRSPVGHGRLELIVRRPGLHEREVLDVAELDVELGLVGDDWHRRPSRETPDGSPHPLKQLNVMNARAAEAVAGSFERWPLAGDQLYVDLQLGYDVLPPGSKLLIGEAVVEVTAPPHRGCPKFTKQFGRDAMRWVNTPDGRSLNLRGICARVVESGTIRTGDVVIAVVTALTPG